ncbi:hypothetical protein DK419_13195 [Methylobacterium terrae]|uniref:Uncharacterized protein n=1 Tax=Methylobacterium terrae TaxID=2202827 RepID=A0A2U8WPM3_9HYPH|nr:hypothetical protein [Methylobacterium terrae]AWN47152.1 hypothetical protein DK419_13195 [Methylobacterium terrae]
MLNRIRQDQPYTDSLKRLIETTGDMSAQFHAMATKLGRNPDLTPVGQRAELSKYLKGDFAPRFAAVTRPLRKAQGYAKAQRAGFKPPPIDRTDPIGEMRRQEMRSYLRSLPPGERTAAAYALAEDPEGASAIIDAPALLSGILPHQQNEIRERHEAAEIERKHGPALAALEAQEEDYEWASALATVVRNEMQEASGMTRDAFEDFMQVIEADADK